MVQIVVIANSFIATFVIILGLAQIFVAKFFEKMYLEAPYKKLLGISLLFSALFLIIFTGIEYITRVESALELFEKYTAYRSLFITIYAVIWLFPLITSIGYMIAYIKPTWSLAKTYGLGTIITITILTICVFLGLLLQAFRIMLAAFVIIIVLTGVLMSGVEKRTKNIITTYSKYITHKLIKYDILLYILMIPEGLFITIFFINQYIATMCELTLAIIGLTILIKIIKECNKNLKQFEEDHTIKIEKVILL